MAILLQLHGSGCVYCMMVFYKSFQRWEGQILY